MYQRVYDFLLTIPKGKVVTYGQIAVAVFGNIGYSRFIGKILHKNPDPALYPCYKVVNASGRLAPAFAFGGQDVQKMLLEHDGIEVRDDFTVDIKKYIWCDADMELE